MEGEFVVFNLSYTLVGASQVVVVVKNPPASAGDVRDADSVPRFGEMLWRRAWQSAPVFLRGESHGQRSLTSYSPRGCKESVMTEVSYYTCTQTLIEANCGEPYMKVGEVSVLLFWWEVGGSIVNFYFFHGFRLKPILKRKKGVKNWNDFGVRKHGCYLMWLRELNKSHR